jgi:deoxyribonuclease V
MTSWPTTRSGLEALQYELAAAEPEPYRPHEDQHVAGVFVCFARTGGDRGWAGAAVYRQYVAVTRACIIGTASGPYIPGLLALREGPLLERAVLALRRRPDVLLVNATGRDHSRGAGLALHLGAVLDVPSVGVTHRPLLAEGDPPGGRRGDSSPLTVDGSTVGAYLRVQSDALPLAVSAGWRTDVATAVEVVLDATGDVRTPRPLREARERARIARAIAEGRAPG